MKHSESKRDATIGKIIVHMREKKGITRDTLAKKLKISAAYMGHIERDDPFRISERVFTALKKQLGRELSKFEHMVLGHNYYATLWRRNWEHKHRMKTKKEH